MTDDRARDRYEVVVVGAGQAGLAMGYFLARQGRRFVILEGGSALAPAWRARWDSLTLFTPRRYDGLPGLPFPGDPDGYPARDEVISYLEQYAARFELPVELNRAARSLKRGDDAYVVELDDGSVEAEQVVVATGPFQTPRLPGFARALAPEVVQMHSAAYRNPGDVPDGAVLVVGGGNTGFQIATELAPIRQVHLSVGSRQTPLPQTFLGRDLFWWLQKTGLLQKTADSRIGRRAQQRDVLIGSNPRALRRNGVQIRPRASGAAGRTVSFEDGSRLEADAVIWATGFGLDHSWIDLPVAAERGRLSHTRGVSELPGLYFLGLPWQHTRGSALLGWVEDDASYLAGRIEAFEGPRVPSNAGRLTPTN
jgi:putative flavoprotein involved in K+ transport